MTPRFIHYPAFIGLVDEKGVSLAMHFLLAKGTMILTQRGSVVNSWMPCNGVTCQCPRSMRRMLHLPTSLKEEHNGRFCMDEK